jgi:hypothetical protein
VREREERGRFLKGGGERGEKSREYETKE